MHFHFWHHHVHFQSAHNVLVKDPQVYDTPEAAVLQQLPGIILACHGDVLDVDQLRDRFEPDLVDRLTAETDDPRLCFDPGFTPPARFAVKPT